MLSVEYKNNNSACLRFLVHIGCSWHNFEKEIVGRALIVYVSVFPEHFEREGVFVCFHEYS